jgi:hypothetical protein
MEDYKTMSFFSSHNKQIYPLTAPMQRVFSYGADKPFYIEIFLHKKNSNTKVQKRWSLNIHIQHSEFQVKTQRSKFRHQSSNI